MSIILCQNCNKDLADWVVHHSGPAVCPYCHVPLSMWDVKTRKITERMKGGLAFFVLFLLLFGALGAVFFTDPWTIVVFGVVASTLSLAAVVVWAETRPRAPVDPDEPASP